VLFGDVRLKIKVKINRKYNTFITVLACISAVWMMVVRFDFPIESVIKYTVISVAMVAILIAIAAPVALLARWWAERKNSHD